MFKQAFLLAFVAEFFAVMFSVCCNGKLPNKKLDQAMNNLHDKSPIFHTGEHPTIWIPNAGVH